jgi:hypothetical protein
VTTKFITLTRDGGGVFDVAIHHIVTITQLTVDGEEMGEVSLTGYPRGLCVKETRDTIKKLIRQAEKNYG